MTVSDDKRTEELKTLFLSLEEGIAEFNAWWMGHVADIEVYQLPVLSEAEVPEELSVSVFKGEEAIELARRAYSQFVLKEAQHPVTAFRLPGYIRLDCNDLSRVHDINALKDALHTQIKALVPDPWRRTRYCRQLFPGLSMGQIYRHIPICHPDAVAIRFTWSPTTVSTRQVARGEALEELEKLRENPNYKAHTERQQSLDIALDTLNSLSEPCALIRRTPVAPHPRVTVSTTLGRGAQKTMIHANLPLLVPADAAIIRFQPLATFNRSRRRSTRADKSRVTPVHLATHLYWVNTN